jgi:hypothetical protein
MNTDVLKASIALAITVTIIALVGAVTPPTLEAQGQPDLEALHQRLLPLFELDGVVYTDADERTGRFTIGVTNRGLETAIRSRLNGLGVASQSVDVVLSEPIVRVQTLQGSVRPIEGGPQIRFDLYLCTLGFNAVLTGTGTEGFVVNSHCTGKQGGVQGTMYYQPLNQVPGELIGTEIADPLYQRNISGCPRGKVCRKSDSAFVQRAPGVAAFQGIVAKTDSVNTGSLTIASDQFRIMSKGSSKVGDVVNKVGRTTGWTQGVVTNKCVNTAVSGTNIVQLCQDFVSAGVGGGDSSSPVFFIGTTGNDVQLRGILWGGNTSGTQFVYSPIQSVEDELGTIAVCDSHAVPAC